MNRLKYVGLILPVFTCVTRAEAGASRAIQHIPNRSTFECTADYAYTDPIPYLAKDKYTSDKYTIFARDVDSAKIAFLNRIEAQRSADGDDLMAPRIKGHGKAVKVVDFECTAL